MQLESEHMENNNEKNAKVQKALNKLIADEWFAGNVYRMFAIAVNGEHRDAIVGQLLSVASDELNDHYKSLVDYALQNGYSVPATYSEMKKLADKADVKLFENAKKSADALWYVDEAIESEKRAIAAYEEYVDDYEYTKIPELFMILQNNYYDEQQHLKDFSFTKSMIEASEKFG